MLTDDLTAYINEKHTQEECIGFIDGYNAALAKLKLFSIPDVVGQSQQLICDTCKSGLIDYPEINRRTCRCGGLGYNVTD